MMMAADISATRIKRRTNMKQVHWWNESIADLRKQCTKERRNWTKAKSAKKKYAKRGKGEVEDNGELKNLDKRYRESKKELVQAISKAKEESWKSLIREIDKDPWRILYKLVMNKLRLTIPGMTETLEENTLKKVIYKLFPRETEPEAIRDIYRYPRMERRMGREPD